MMSAHRQFASLLPILAFLITIGCGGNETANADSATRGSEASESADSLTTVIPTDDLTDAEPAHDFSLPGVSGDFSLSDHRGEIVVLNFWATWNELSVEGMDAVNQVHAELGSDGIAVVGIAQDEGGLDVIRDWAGDHSIGYPLVADASQTVARQFGEIELLPTTVIIDRQGMIREQHTGILTHDELLDLLGPILIEEDAPLSDLPALIEGEGPLFLSPLDVHVLVSQGAMLVDVRSRREVEATGTALDAEHCPLFALAPQDLPANLGVAVIFLGNEGGEEAQNAADRAIDWGYPSVYVVQGGLAAWQAAGLPTEPLAPEPTEVQPVVRARSVIG